jgi:hypothetical protein
MCAATPYLSECILDARFASTMRLQGVWTCSKPVLESASRVKWRVGEGWGRDRSFAEVVAASVLLVPSKKNVLDASSAVAAPTLPEDTPATDQLTPGSDFSENRK